jgi:hypothetical protein
MPSKEHFRNLAQMARRVSANMTNRDIADRLEAIGRDFDHQAEEAPNTETSHMLVLAHTSALGKVERT